jgi:hypothetical protein
MSVRSRYTGTRQPRQPPVATHKPQKTGITTKAKNAIKAFAKYVEKNQRDYQRDTGDTSLGQDLRNIPIRVIRETGKLGSEESRRIQSMTRRDSDDEIVRFMSGRGSKPQQHACPQSHQHLEMTVKEPAKRPKKKPVKIVYLPYDPEAEVG